VSVGHSEELYTVNEAIGNIVDKILLIQNLERCIYDNNVTSPANNALKTKKMADNGEEYYKIIN
jgi:hypothetical protein